MNTIQTRREEKGQALILVILAIAAIFGFAALAIDGGMLFLDRRAAQNAADAAALSAGYAKCQGQNPTAAALEIAEANGFKDNGDDLRVTVNNPPLTGSKAGNSEYIEVIIKAHNDPVFLGLISQTPMETTTRSVSHCNIGTAAGAKQPGLGGEVALLALNKTASGAITNTGSAKIIVDGGVFDNSTAEDALSQTGSATMKMNWAKIRGGADLSGAFGMNADGTGEIAKQIDVVGNFHTSGSGKAISGAFNIGGSVINSASVNMTGNPMNVGGSFDNSGAGTINASSLIVGGNIVNGGSGSFTSEQIMAGGNVTASGSGKFTPPSGSTLNMTVKGNIALSGSAKITGNVTMEGNYTHSGSSSISGSVTQTTVTKPTFSVTIPEMTDPLATILNPPVGPAGSCTNLDFPNYGTFNPTMTSGGYYCDLDIGGSVTSKIPPGTYWVDSFSLGGSAKLTMDGVQLFITGKGASTAFKMAGSTTISMVGTMIYVRSGAFSLVGSSGALAWTAPGTGDFQGLALFMDRANNSPASQTGSTTISNESGTWYAPASKCSFTGSTSTTIYSQFICDKITVTGSSNLTIQYDSTLVYQAPAQGTVSEVSLEE